MTGSSPLIPTEVALRGRTPAVQMMELRPREAEQLARGSTAGEPRSWDRSPGAGSMGEASLQGQERGGEPGQDGSGLSWGQGALEAELGLNGVGS